MIVLSISKEFSQKKMEKGKDILPTETLQQTQISSYLSHFYFNLNKYPAYYANGTTQGKVKWSEVKWSEVKWSEVKWSEVKWSGRYSIEKKYTVFC